MITMQCPQCGKPLELPDHVAGKRATCPYCNRDVTVPGSASRVGGSGEKPHMAELLKDMASEPSLAPPNSEWRAAQRHRHIPGYVTLVAFATIVGGVVRERELFYDVVGASQDWSKWVFFGWVFATYILGFAACMSTVSSFYYRYTRRSYTDDRVGFAKAGGYDIGTVVPLVAFAGIFAAYWWTNRAQEDAIAIIRNPWLFSLVGAVIAHTTSAVTARFVFRARFGTAGLESWRGNLKPVASMRRARLLSRAEKLAAKGQRAAAMQLLEEAAASARRDRADDQLLACLETQAHLLWDTGRGDIRGAMARLKEMETVIRGQAKPDRLSGVLSQQAVMLLDGGDVKGALDLFRQVERYCRQARDDRGLMISLANQAKALVMQGRPREALPMIEEAFALSQKPTASGLAAQIQAIRQMVHDRLR